MSAERKRHKEAERKDPSKARAKPHAIAPAEAAVTLPPGLLDDLRSLIEKARSGVAAAVNVETVMLNWHLGQRIWREILGEERAEYGRQIVDALSRQLPWSDPLTPGRAEGTTSGVSDFRKATSLNWCFSMMDEVTS